MPTTELASPINRAVFPGYAKSSRDPEGLRRGFLDVIGTIILFALPAAFVTVIVPVVAPAGTSTVIMLSESTVNVTAADPLNVMLDTPVKPVPRS